ncbi:MAG: diguanylate cyclase, partial [Pseudomonadota bacterium]|nr:diguanylate cyclase [Pseudomonadota bacterium]
MTISIPDQMQEVRAEQVRLLFRSSPGIYLGGLFCLLLTVFLLRNQIPHTVLALWSGLFIVLTFCRAFLSLNYWKRLPEPAYCHLWGWAMVSGSLVSGAIWGSAAFYLYVPHAIIFQTYLILIICGLLAGSVSSLAVYMPAYFAFSLTAGSPFVLRLLIGSNLNTPGGTVTFYLGMLLLFFMIVMFFFAVNTHRTIIESLLYRFRNLDLIDTLEAQIHETRQINSELEQEIFERRQAEGRLRLTYKMMEHTAEGVMALDASHIIVWINAAFTHLTHYNFSSAVGRPFDFLLHDTTLKDLVQDALVVNSHWEGETSIRRQDNSMFPSYVSITVVPNESGEAEHHVVVLTDYTQKKEQEAKVRYLATHDTLTQLPNRALFECNLEAALMRARRLKTRVALLFIDLDQFKRINDALGHPVGDEILVSVGARLRENLREADAVSRLGGDEFTIILEHFNDLKDVETVVRKICTGLSRPIVINNEELVVTPSIGISIFPDDCDDAHTLVKYSDIAMYEVKGSGRNAWRFYSPGMTGSLVEHLSLENALRRALKNH